MPTPAASDSDANFRRLFEDNPIPMWVSEIETLRFLAVNRAAVEQYGYTREEFLGMTVLDISSPEDRERVRAMAVKPVEFEQRRALHRKKSGELVAVEVSAHATVFDGRAARAVTAHDVTQQGSAEERFAAVFHASPIAKALVRTDGTIIEVNAQLATLFGVSQTDLLQTSLLHPTRWWSAEHSARILRALRGDRRWSDEANVRHLSGEKRTVLVTVQPLSLGQSQLRIAVFVDITERKAMEVQLQRFERTESVGRLSAGIAHDMNNVLAPIIMAVPMLRTATPGADTDKILSAVEKSAQRGAALMRQLLIFGRGIEGDRRPIELRPIVAEVVAMCTQTFPKNITLVLQASATAARVNADATQIQQVLLNLAVNARDAMPNGGELTLSIEDVVIDHAYAVLHTDAQPGRYVLVRVGDTGTGIAPEIVERVFDPFFTTKPEGRGTGLGLSTVRGIVKAHGGFMRLESELGRGSWFDVFLPACESDVTELQPCPAAHAIPPGHGELVLIVDDEEAVRRVQREILVRHHYRVLSAEDGVEATAIFAANPDVKLLITDLDMPLMDGVNLARVLRQMKPEIAIVVSTGVGRQSEAKRRGADLDALGVAQVLMKPYTAETLLRIVATALQPPVARETTRSKSPV